MTTDAPALTSESSIATKLRRLVLLDRSSVALGGAAKLGDVLGIGRRTVVHKLAAERGISDAELVSIADALDAKALKLAELAADVRAVICA